MAGLLVVDEDTAAGTALCRILRQAGHEAVHAPDMNAVRDRYRHVPRQQRPVLALVELVRERGNGFSTAVWLQTHGYGRAVLLSDRDEAPDRLWARSRGVHWTLARDCGSAHLCLQLNTILQQLRADDAAPG